MVPLTAPLFEYPKAAYCRWLKALFADAGGLSDLLSQVVKLGTPYCAMPHDLYPVDLGRVNGKGTLNTHAKRNLTHSERLTV